MCRVEVVRWPMLLLLLMAPALAVGDVDLRVSTDVGDLSGVLVTTSRGRDVSAFMAIPYAEPPLGNLRFKAPVEAKPWKGVLNASNDSPICIQSNPYTRKRHLMGTEDCLYLNVYTPKTTFDTKSDLLPVMVFFHGGGWMCGSGNRMFYGPEHLLDQDVVYVGVNYRLSFMGLFSTMDLAAPGNWALKDQSMALTWVQKHIANFGGDPDLVTIFGESAGGASVHYHMMSPKSRGLFHRAILHSGTALCNWANAPPGRTESNARLLAKLMNCPTYDTTKMVDCLRTKSAEELVDAHMNFYDWDMDPMIPFRPVIEPKHDDAFLDEDPRVLLNEGRFAQVPAMFGINENEGALRSAAVVGHRGLLDEMSENFDAISPVTFDYVEAENPKSITKALKDFYFAGEAVDIGTLSNLTDVYSDSFFLVGIDETLSLQLPQSKHPIYFYHFTYKGSNSFSSVFGDPDRDYGACHVDELIYILNIKLFPELNEDEMQMSDTITTIWTNFAKSGKPHLPEEYTPMGDIPEWPTMKEASEWVHVEIGDELKVKTSLADERRRLWRSLPLWQKQHSKVYIGKIHDRDEAEL